MIAARRQCVAEHVAADRVAPLVEKQKLRVCGRVLLDVAGEDLEHCLGDWDRPHAR